MYKLVKKSEATERVQSDSWVIKNYLTKDFSKDFSIATAKLNGKHSLTKSETSDRIYYVTAGSVVFTLEGTLVTAQKGDILFIEKNTDYAFDGKCEVVLINIPAFGV